LAALSAVKVVELNFKIYFSICISQLAPSRSPSSVPGPANFVRNPPAAETASLRPHPLLIRKASHAARIKANHHCKTWAPIQRLGITPQQAAACHFFLKTKYFARPFHSPKDSAPPKTANRSKPTSSSGTKHVGRLAVSSISAANGQSLAQRDDGGRAWVVPAGILVGPGLHSKRRPLRATTLSPFPRAKYPEWCAGHLRKRVRRLCSLMRP
jgi:hypothetical protein